MQHKFSTPFMACRKSRFQHRVRAGGLVAQHKEPKQSKHRPLSECIAEPGEFLLTDFSKMERPPLLHVAFQALEKFKSREKRLPRPGNTEDAAAFKGLCEEVNGSLVRAFSSWPTIA